MFRLKLRCDRKVPCETCTKRGCAAICPNGALATGKANNKYVLANTEELHAKIHVMTVRIRELEVGLAALQATISEEPHPLLKKERMLNQESSPAQSSGSSPQNPTDTAGDADDEGIIEAFGTLSIGVKGDTKFYGASARSEYILQSSKLMPKLAYTSSTRLHPRIVELMCPELEGDKIDPEIKRLVYAHLPPLSEACQMCETFMNLSQYIPSSLNRKQLFDEVLSLAYQAKPSEGMQSLHALSLLFIVFALAKQYDTTTADYHIEAYDYFVLSRVVLLFDSPITSTTVLAVQVMCYMAQYLEITDSSFLPTGSSRAWMYLGYAVKLAHGVNLKSTRWNLDEEESQKRSRVFWHLFTVDAWNSFSFGRPPTTMPSFIDCELPVDDEDRLKEDGTKDLGFQRWSFLYCQLLHTVMCTAFGAKSPPYITILELDRRIRDFIIPEFLRPPCDGTPDDPPADILVKRWMVHSSKEWTLLNLHRVYFAQALREKPEDPLKHKYGPSVMAIYRSGYRVIEFGQRAMSALPQSFFRSTLAWSKVLSAAIVMCLLVCNAPTSSLAPSALEELDITCSFFENAVRAGSRPAAEHLDAIRSLYRQAHEAMDKTQPHGNQSMSAELQRMGRGTQVISQSSSPSAGLSSPSLDQRAMPNHIPLYHPLVSDEQMHPTILNDFQAFETFPPTPQPSTSSSLPASSTSMFNLFDFPSTGYSQPGDAQSLQMSFTDMSPFVTGASAQSGMYQSPTQQESLGATSGQPYILDATWQDFVEQLGF
ncbi:hypothetical protein HETIRDRAFT_308468 [Heterobasidion irregulare TC 32-1]|uniref:4Fe-4S ferredoxin-type domain-containing protein n=1 Tax=Heterobasidion irregulare (strain TC 32-1) TaxID=747525 RepID=W4KLR6_HETIT|nr:uncharacterized protein HETIRDRAFT_308468 [Heterobasidion irregulare TC 32-1]ETW86659.1 hypothetical protein HETIRDRAFT_308468 [Heterobasidion irregulare TC 32-1]